MSESPKTPMERAQAAATAARNAFSANPGNAMALVIAAEAMLRVGDRAEAGALVDLAASASPAGFQARRGISGVMGALARREEAIHWGRLAVETDPGDAGARLHLAGVLLSAKLPADALREAEAHVRLPRAQPSGWRLLSTARMAMGDPLGAVEAAARAVEGSGGAPDFRLHLAGLLGQVGRHADGIAEADEVIRASPEDARAWRVRSGLRESVGDIAGAIEDAERAVALVPGDESFRTHRDHVARALGIWDSGEAPAAPASAPASQPHRELPREGMGEAIRGRMRTVGAIILREIRTRHARSRLGYTWAVLEPIGHLATLGVVFGLLNHNPPPVGDSLFLFYITGLVPFLMFSHTTNEVTVSRDSAGGLLQLPAVGPLDPATARGVLQLWTETIVAILLLTAAAVLGAQGMPADPFTTAMGFLVLWLMGMGMGLVGMVIAHFLPAWDQLWGAVVRLLYFASGIYYSPISMPSVARDILVWNPVLQGIEWVRVGFYQGYDPPWLDRPYTLAVTFCIVLFGLCLENAARNRLRRGVE